MISGRAAFTVAFMGACVLAGGPARGEDPPPADRFLWGGTVDVGQPRGAFGRAADTGVGASLHAMLRTKGGGLGWRLEGGWLVYGSERLAPPRGRGRGRGSRDDAFTENSVGHAVTGPILMVTRGPVRPYASAFAGVSYFETATEVRPRRLGPAAGRDPHLDDTVFTYGAGAGVLAPLGRSGVSIDLGARYSRSRDARYLAEGDLREGPGGALSFSARRGDADVLEFRIGLTVGR